MPPPPSPTLRWANFAASQIAWLAAVMTAAQGHPAWGLACIAAVIAWHLGVSARPWREAMLVGVAALVGTLAETLQATQHLLVYAHSPDGLAAPAWIIGLWALFAISLNVNLRWLRGRPLLAAAVGAIAGPAAFASGVRLGAARLVEPLPALAMLAVVWALALPLLVHASSLLDGVSKENPTDA